MTLRELNRTLLLRQLLLERRRLHWLKVVTRLVALQAQYAPSPYVALWSRIEGFRKEQLTRALASGGRQGRLAAHDAARDVARRVSVPRRPPTSSRSAVGRRASGVDIELLRAALPHEPTTSAELFELGYRVLETDDRWTVAFAYRALPFVRTAPVGRVAAHEALAVRARGGSRCPTTYP